MVPWKPETIDWRDYIVEVHAPGIRENVAPEIDKKLQKEAKPLRKHDNLLDLLAEAGADRDLVQQDAYSILFPDGREERFGDSIAPFPLDLLEILGRSPSLGLMDVAGDRPGMRALLAYDPASTFARWDAVDQYTILPGARRFENWENYEAGKIGLGVAVRYLLDVGMDAASKRLTGLAESLRQRLSNLPGIKVRDLGREKGGIVTFSHAEADLEKLAQALRAQHINVSTTKATSTQIDMTRRRLDRMVRASVHYYNTESEIDRFVDAIGALTR